MARAKAKIVFAIAGASAEEKIGNFGFFEGTFSAILTFIAQKGLQKENIIVIDAHSATDYYIFYWKG